jgi:hypothetical protein
MDPLDLFGRVKWAITPPPGESSVEDQILLMRSRGLPIEWSTRDDGTVDVTTKRPFAGIVKLMITQCLQSTYPGYGIVECDSTAPPNR